MNKEELILEIDAELKKLGFQRKSGSWYLNEKEVIKVVNLQKSNYSDLYYVNIGAYFKEIDGKENFPKEQQCHIRTRLNSWIVNSQVDYNYLFDLDTLNITEQEFRLQIKKCVSDNIIPQLEAIDTKERILKIIDRNPTFLNTIPLKVKAYLGM
ncbi:DUF4304 domain-containing protein [Mucilaginibacter sp. KACC 22773]|jgi:hypothetical protein|uniref:DUF4304 domain-containing protein n=1 Tax=Mucilaginibacter sp. KACC 22773 TaxID=3025671 RepID=UPI002365D754|nr:DUF4304 domain-containing protein [Mucilaginibacter sp. KACC 22773]WDF76661.1 DUF4304 domain-containing protein [Mucilaginibacter sp. KACC 22773]